jgi:hypothetical protein
VCLFVFTIPNGMLRNHTKDYAKVFLFFGFVSFQSWFCFFFFNTIVTNDESDEQNFHTFCINLHLSLFGFECNSIEYESNCT